MRLSPDTFYAEDTQGDTEMKCSLSAARNYRRGDLRVARKHFQENKTDKKTDGSRRWR